jgi:transposase
MTYSQFIERFPDNAACLEYLKERFFVDGTECPKCGKASKFHRIKSRSAYSCQFCGNHVYPTAGTIFHKTTVSLQLWFYAIYLMSSTRCGISAKQLEREIGVTYKTAHRMFKQIRTLLAEEDDGPLEGDVEVDESWYGGKPRAADTRAKRGRILKTHRPTILAMVERGGRVLPLVIPDRGTRSIRMAVKQHVLPSSMLFTDEWDAYKTISKEYRGHRRIKHEAQDLRDWGDPHADGRGLLRPLQERGPWRLPRHQHRLSTSVSGRVRLPLQPAPVEGTDVLGDPQPRPEGKSSFFLARFVVAFSRSRKKSASVCAGSCFTSGAGGVGLNFSGRLRAAIRPRIPLELLLVGARQPRLHCLEHRHHLLPGGLSHRELSFKLHPGRPGQRDRDVPQGRSGRR